MNVRRLKPSPLLAVAAVALVVGLAAPAAATEASHMINGSSIKNHSITGKKLKKHTVTGKQIKESSLGTVPKAASLTAMKWHAITHFSNGWHNANEASRPAAYGVDAQGTVHLRGVISGGTVDTPAFTLPASITPPSGLSIYLLTLGEGNAAAVLDINPNGAYPQVSGSTTTTEVSDYLGLEGLTFSKP